MKLPLTQFVREVLTTEASDFQEWHANKLPAPMRDAVGVKFVKALSKLRDALAGRAQEAAALTLSALTPSDALAENVRERNLDRGLTESDDSLRAWLRRSWELWQDGGTTNSIAVQLGHLLGIDPALVKVTGIWPFQTGLGVTRVVLPPPGYSTTPEPGWEVHDKDTAQWARFWIEIDAAPPWGFGARLWDDGGVWDGDMVWDSLATPTEVEQILNIINKWKPAHTRLAGLKFSTSTPFLVGAPGLFVGAPGLTVGGGAGGTSTVEWTFGS